MPDPLKNNPSDHVVIACGGTGGHLFPGLAVGQELRQRGCAVTLMVSPKAVDQQAIQSIRGMGIVTLPAVGLSLTKLPEFIRGMLRSYKVSRACFKQRPPRFVLAMGGYISAPPILAAKPFGAKTFLHESNSIPGRANRWLARWVDGAFVFFPRAGQQLSARRVEVAGMPVRPEFLEPLSRSAARSAMGLDPQAPVLLVTGGSQGARAVNDLVLEIAPQLRAAVPNLQFIHLTGALDFDKVRDKYKSLYIQASVHAFWKEMNLCLAAADVAISRSGASSLAEMAARQLPAVLIPYPAAANNHQYYNAEAFVQAGAACVLKPEECTAENLLREVLGLLSDPVKRASMQSALASWFSPRAASEIADRILNWPAKGGEAHSAAVAALKPHNLGPLNV